MRHCTKYKLSALQVRISGENILKLQLTTAKISDYTLKQGSKTHLSLRQSNLQLQNGAAKISHRIRAWEVRGWAGWHTPDLQDGILLKPLLGCTRSRGKC